MPDTTTKCTHCHREISGDKWPVHAEGGYRGKHRCSPEDSGLPYGYEAHTEGTACEYPCLGAGERA